MEAVDRGSRSLTRRWRVRDRLASCTCFQPKYQVPAKLGKDQSSEEDHFSPERRLTKSWASIWTWCLAERGPITPLRQATPCLFCFPLPYGLTLLISAACAASRRCFLALVPRLRPSPRPLRRRLRPLLSFLSPRLHRTRLGCG
jgi:hypothetical protein